MADEKKVFGKENYEIVPVGGALEALNRSEIDIQISTAKKYPRSIELFKQKVKDLAMLDKETAKECRYALPRGGKTISGPSVRFSEIVAASYGNVRVAARVIAVEEKFVVAQGAVHDLENNYAMTTEVRRRITDRNGRRYNDDMITMTANAACSLARRNATFAVVPKALTKSVYDEVEALALGDGTPLNVQRDRMLEMWGEKGITDKQVFAVLGRKGKADVTIQDVADMRSLWTAIQDGMTSLEDAFSEQAMQKAPEKPKQTDGAEALKNAQASVEEEPGAPHDEEKKKPEEHPAIDSLKGEPKFEQSAEEKAEIDKDLATEPKKAKSEMTVKERLVAEVHPLRLASPDNWKAALVEYLKRQPTEKELRKSTEDLTQRSLQALKLILADLPVIAPVESVEQIQPDAGASLSGDESEPSEQVPGPVSGEPAGQVEEVSKEQAERQKLVAQIKASKCGANAKMRAIKEAIPAKLDEANLLVLAQEPDKIVSDDHLKAAAQIISFMPDEEKKG